MRKRIAVVPLAPGEVPLELRAGRCREVWAPGYSDDRWLYRAWRRWDRARDWWLYQQGIRHGDHRNYPRAVMRPQPWSFDYLAVHDPDHLAEVLAWRGLSLDWTPTPAGPEWDREPPGDWYAARGPAR